MGKRNTVLTELISAAEKSGYLLYDDVSDASDNSSLSFADFDWLMDQLSMRKIKIYDSQEDVLANDIEDEDESDKDDYDLAHIDYESVFREVVEIEPSLSDFIDKIRNIVSARFGEYVYILDQLKKEDLTDIERKKLINRIIETHLRVAVAQALSYYGKHPYTQLSEDISLAYLGLVEAASKLDPYKKFSTVTANISFSIFRILQRYAQTKAIVYYPVHVMEKLNDIFYELYDYIKDDDFEGMVEIIASEFHVDRKKAVNYANLYSGYLLYEYGDDDSFFDSDCFDDDDRRQIDIYHNMRVINVAQSRNIDPCLETVNN